MSRTDTPPLPSPAQVTIGTPTDTPTNKYKVPPTTMSITSDDSRVLLALFALFNGNVTLHKLASITSQYSAPGNEIHREHYNWWCKTAEDVRDVLSAPLCGAFNAVRGTMSHAGIDATDSELCMTVHRSDQRRP